MTGWWEEVQRVYLHLIVAPSSCCELAVGRLVKVGLPSTSPCGTKSCKRSSPSFPFIASYLDSVIPVSSDKHAGRPPNPQTSHIAPDRTRPLRESSVQESPRVSDMHVPPWSTQANRAVHPDRRRRTGRTCLVDGRVPPRCRIRRASEDVLLRLIPLLSYLR